MLNKSESWGVGSRESGVRELSSPVPCSLFPEERESGIGSRE
ncbi:hypothetical protein [Spirulina subsalsa]|nr:hypothetical protein [Spirulina subsalsa]